MRISPILDRLGLQEFGVFALTRGGARRMKSAELRSPALPQLTFEVPGSGSLQRRGFDPGVIISVKKPLLGSECRN